MSYKRISIRFNLDIEDERNAWELLHAPTKKEKRRADREAR